MNKIAIKTNPKLWESIKRKWIRGSKAGAPGKVSARKMQLAVQEYKRKGGGYKGSKGSSLTKWTQQKWGYISSKSKPLKKSKTKSRKPKSRKPKSRKPHKKSKTKSRKPKSRKPKSRKPHKKSRSYGRYLPLKVRKSLTKKEKEEENRRKGYKYGRRVPYSSSVKAKMRKLKIY